MVQIVFQFQLNGNLLKKKIMDAESKIASLKDGILALKK